MIKHIQVGVAAMLAWFTISEVPLHLLVPILAGLAVAPFRHYPSFRWPKDEIPERWSALAGIVWLIVFIGAWSLNGSLSIRLLAFAWVALFFWVYWSIRNDKAKLRNNNQHSRPGAVSLSCLPNEAYMTVCPVHQTPLMQEGSSGVCTTCEGTWLPREAAVATIGSYYRPSSRRAVDLLCPEDGSQLRAIKRGGALLQICPDCGGVWLEKEALKIAVATKPTPRRPGVFFLTFIGLIAVLGPIAAVPLLKGAYVATGHPLGWPVAAIGGGLGIGALGLSWQAVMMLIEHFRNGRRSPHEHD